MKKDMRNGDQKMKQELVSKKKSLLQHFGKVFQQKTSDDKEIPSKERKIYLHPTNVFGVIPKTKQFENLLVSTFDVNGMDQPSNLDYNVTDKREVKCKYGSEYLKVLLELCKHYESVTLQMKAEYPLRAETDDFIFILAPRVESD